MASALIITLTTICCILLTVIQATQDVCTSGAPYNTIQIKLEVQKQDNKRKVITKDQENALKILNPLDLDLDQNHHLDITIKDLIITGFDPTPFKSFKPSIPDKLSLRLNNDNSHFAMKLNDNPFTLFKWIDITHEKKYKFVSLHDSNSIVTKSKAELLEMMLQRKIAIKKDNNNYFITPKPLYKCMELDNNRMDMKIITKHDYGTNARLIITEFDLTYSGYTPPIHSHQKGYWFNMIELKEEITVSNAKFVLDSGKRNLIYFYERIKSDPYVSWKAYYYKNTTTQSHNRNEDKFFFKRLIFNQYKHKKLKDEYRILTADQVNVLAKRRMIAFDATYLLIGLHKSSSSSTQRFSVGIGTDKENGNNPFGSNDNKHNDDTEKEEYPLSGSGGRLPNFRDYKAYVDMNDDNDEYYDEYYEDASRLLRWAKYFGLK